jgi:DNA polymerase
MDQGERQPLIDLLAWYRAMGVTDALAGEPRDWLAHGDGAPGAQFPWPDLERLPSAPPSPAARPRADAPPPSPRPAVGRARETPAPSPAPVRRFPSDAPDAAEQSARQLASAANSMADLAAALQRFDGCGLKATAKNTCVWRGAERADLMVVGEAPGREEDLEGKPFVGRAGQLLDKMLAAIGIDESSVHITNIVYWRPPGNRTPTPQEAQICRPFLLRQIELAAPKVIVALGGTSAKLLFDEAEGIMRIRGRWREIQFGTRKIAAMATLHPAYLLRTPVAKRLAWRDLLAVAARLEA